MGESQFSIEQNSPMWVLAAEPDARDVLGRGVGWVQATPLSAVACQAGQPNAAVSPALSSCPKALNQDLGGEKEGTRAEEADQDDDVGAVGHASQVCAGGSTPAPASGVDEKADADGVGKRQAKACEPVDKTDPRLDKDPAVEGHGSVDNAVASRKADMPAAHASCVCVIS